MTRREEIEESRHAASQYDRTAHGHMYGFMPRTPAHAHNTQNRICLRAYRGAHANEDAADEGKEDGGAQHGIVARAADLAEDEDCTTHTAACKRG